MTDFTGPVGVILTISSAGGSAWLVSFLARKKERATTENLQANTESTTVATDNSVTTTGLTVLQAVMLALQQENLRLTTEISGLEAEKLELAGQLKTAAEQNSEPYRVQLEHQAGTLTRLRAQIVAVQTENVRLQSLIEDQTPFVPPRAPQPRGTPDPRGAP